MQTHKLSAIVDKINIGIDLENKAMPTSDSLKQAALEISAILDKYDIAGAVALHKAPGFAVHMVKIDPSYSCATFEEGKLKLKNQLSDFDGNVRFRDLSVTCTCNMFENLALIVESFAGNFRRVSNMLKETFGAEFFNQQIKKGL